MITNMVIMQTSKSRYEKSTVGKTENDTNIEERKISLFRHGHNLG